METTQLALFLIVLGAFFLLLSVLKTNRLLRALKTNKIEFNLWRILFFLMIFFFVGYLVSLFLILTEREKILLLITGLVFCFGGLFVYIVTKISASTINELIDKSKCELVNKELKYSLVQLEEYKHFFYYTHDFSCIANFDGYFQIINPRWERVLGYTKDELLKKRFTDFIHPDDIPATLKEMEKLKTGAQTINFINRYCKKDGTYLWFDWISTSDIATGKIFAVARDITSRINIERELESSETKFRKIVEEVYDGVYTCDAKGIFTFVNSGCTKITEYSEKELIGKHFLDLIVPDHHQEAAAFYQDQFNKRTSETLFSFPIITKTGKKKWVEQTVSLLSEKNWVTGFQCIVRDVTERVIAEIKLTEKSEKLKRSNEELEQFAYVTTHDLQEPLRTIANYVELFNKKYVNQVDSDADKYIKFIMNATETMQILIKELLDFSRIGKKPVFEPVNCNEIINSIINEMQVAIKESNAKINISELPILKGNNTELRQLFRNLFSNALKFRKKGRVPEISISCEESSDEYVFAFKDNGIGIESQYLDRIFIIFQRLHNATEYSGTGIGLATCKKIVEMRGGKMWVESKPDEGSTFYFSMPKKV